MLLSSWAETFPSLLEGKNVLELGSGLGLFGLTLARRRSSDGVGVKSFTFTDCHPAVVNFLHLNAQINLNEVIFENARRQKYF